MKRPREEYAEPIHDDEHEQTKIGDAKNVKREITNDYNKKLKCQKKESKAKG